MSIVHVTKENFQQEVLQAKKPVVVDFWASWCGPCRMLAPVLEEIAAETDRAVIAKVNVDEQPELAQQFGIMSIPTLVFFKDGRVTDTLVGLRDKAAILSLLKKTKEETKMKYICDVCGYEYDEAVGDPDNGIAPGTKWEDLPEDFVCPLCGVGKDQFSAE